MRVEGRRSGLLDSSQVAQQTCPIQPNGDLIALVARIHRKQRLSHAMDSMIPWVIDFGRPIRRLL